MNTPEFDGTDPNTGSTQGDVAAAVEAITTDLDDVIDPYRLEVPLAIDAQGHFLAWMDAESRVVPVPPADQVQAPHDSGDFSTEITQDGFKRFTPRAVDAAEPTAFHPTSAAIDAVFAELEASAKAHVEPTHDPIHEHASMLEVEAHVDSGFHNQAEPETDARRLEIDPLALENSFEQIPFELIGEQPMMLEVEAQVEVQAEVQVESETQASMNPAVSEFGLENTELEAMLVAINSATESQDASAENLLEQDRMEDQMTVYEMEGVPVTNLSQQLENHMLGIGVVSVEITQPVVAHINESTEAIKLPMLPATTIIRRHFDATDLIEAQKRLQQALRPLEVSVLALLARAAERCSLELPGINAVVIAKLTEHGITVTAQVKAVESFREVLAGIAQSSSGATGGLCVLDIQNLGFSETILRLSGPHLMLTQLSQDPEKSGRMRGTISLCGYEDAQAGTAFLDQVVSKLESPITLMV